MTVGERLRQARKTAKLSGEKLGEYIGVSKGQISNIEKGTSDLTKANAIVLAGVLDVSFEWLMYGTGAPATSSQSNTAKGNANIQAGRDVQHPGAASDREQRLASALLEIEYLKQRLQDKDQIIALMAGKA